MRLRLLTLLAAACCACAPKPVHIGIVFDTSWHLPGTALSASEISLVRTSALETLRAAFGGFAVTVTEEPVGDHLIRIEDTPSTPYGAGNPVHPGAVGLTFPLVTTSRVRVDALYTIELAVARCRVACALTRDAALVAKGTSHHAARVAPVTVRRELANEAERLFAARRPLAGNSFGLSTR